MYNDHLQYKERKYEKINFDKFNLPKEHNIVQQENVFSSVEQWPSFSTGRNIPIENIILSKTRLLVLDEANSKRHKITPKPKFLEHLDQYIIDQIKKHQIKDNGINPVRLQIYREVFDWIIDAFKTYQPLLSKIKKEYELNLSFLREEIRRLEPMKEMLWTISEERDQQVLILKQKENTEICQLKKEKFELSQKVLEFEANLETLKCQIDTLYDGLGCEHLACRKEADAKKLLIIDINELKTQLEDMSQFKKDKDTDVVEDSLMLRFALEEAKKAQAKSVKELSEVKAIYADFVPMNKYQVLRERYENLVMEQKVLIEKLSTSDKNLRSLDEKYAALIKQRDFYYFKYMDLTKATGSSSQNWDRFSEFVGNGVDKMPEGSVKEKSQLERSSALSDDIKDNQSLKKISLIRSKLEDDSYSNDDKDEISKMRSKIINVALKSPNLNESENKAVIRTMMEMMCELPPGAINPNFDPMNLYKLLNQEKLRRETLSKESKNSKKKHID